MTVTPTPLRPQAPERTTVDLAEHRQLLADIATVKAQKKQIEELEKQLAEKLKNIIGIGNEGTLDGMPVYRYVPGGKVASAALKRDHPEFWEDCADMVAEWKLNTDRLAERWPQLYAEYVEKKLIPVGTRPVFVITEEETVAPS
jgi:hypothetical protein